MDFMGEFDGLAATITETSVTNGKKDKKNKKSGGFQSMGLSGPVYKGIVKKGYKLPTPIQRKAIPVLLTGVDVVGMARTGSGKTAAFVVPMLEKLGHRKKGAPVRGLIFSPTRELATQTCSVCKQLGKFTDLRCCLITGGAGMEMQFEALAAEPDIIIATPGRLMHHLVETGLSLKAVSMCVFDEADRLFEMGFATQLHEILRRLPPTRQTALFSATLPAALAEFTRAGLNKPTLIRLDAESKLSDDLKIQFLSVQKEAKAAVLIYLVREVVPQDQQALVFAATKHHVEFLHKLLELDGLQVGAVYGTMDMTARKENIARFRSRQVRVLVVTDVAARGLDIPLLDNVINFDFPARPKLFVHRAGRVARAGRTGLAYSLVSSDEVPYMLDLFLFLGRPLHTDFTAVSSYDEKTPYFGCLPQHLVDEVMESYKVALHEAQVNGLLATCNRAYKMYYKTRAAASGASAVRAKELPRPSPIHPAFAGEVAAEHTAVRKFISQMHKRSSTVTIFEAIDRENMMMAHKRVRDDQLIEQDRFKKKQAKELKAIRDRRQEADEDEENGEDSHALYEQQEAPSARKRQSSALKRKLEPTATVQLGPQAPVARDKPRLSAAARKRQKRLAKTEGQKSIKAKKAEKGKTAEKVLDTTASHNSGRGDKTAAAFKDSQYFIEGRPKGGLAKEIADRGYAVNDDSRKIDSLVMDVAPDDDKGMVKAQMVRKWDKRKKRYVTERMGGEKPFGTITVRNESGKKIDKKVKPGALYEKWKKKHLQSVNKADPAETANIDTLFAADEEPLHAQDESASRTGGGGRGIRGGRGGHGAGLGSGGRERRRGGSARVAAGSKGPRNEIKAPERIRKEQQEKAKRQNYLKFKKKKSSRGRK